MPKPRKPRCFVAMAFGHEDTDGIYDNAIRPVLRNNDVIPVIINRREDNRDINHQIIEQLQRSDFCIADLTYTRPSVYYEAGYAQREVEVIYTVRRDHLGKNQPEDKRVHFDLQMKPIVVWKDPTDATFADRLEKRLRGTVLRDLGRKARQYEKLSQEKANFGALSVNKRLQLLRRKAINGFHRVGFREWSITGVRYDSSLRDRTFRNPSHLSRFGVTFVGRRRKKRVLQLVTVRASESFTLKQLRLISAGYGRSSYPSHLRLSDREELLKFERTDEHHVLLSLRNTPESRIMSAMPYLSKRHDDGAYFYETTYLDQGYNRPDIRLSRQVSFCFFSNIQCESVLRKDLLNVAEQL